MKLDAAKVIGSSGGPGAQGLKTGIMKVATVFDDRKLVAQQRRLFRRVLKKFGAFTRQTARRSLKRAPKYSMAEIKANPEAPYAIRYWRKVESMSGAKTSTGRKKTVPKPEKISKEGDPPFVHGRKALSTSPLRKLIMFSTTMNDKSVVVGPIKFSGAEGPGPGALEYGKRNRPFMTPAFDENIRDLDRIIRLSIKPSRR